MMAPQSEWPPSVPSLGKLVEIGDGRDLRWFGRKYWWRILVCAVFCLAIAAVFNHFFPPVYISEAKVRFMPPQVAGRFVNPNFSMEVEQRLFALSQLLGSRLTASKLTESLGLYPERRSFATVADLAPRFQQHLEIVQTKSTEGEKNRSVPTLHLRFAYPEPEKAQKVVQKLVEQIYEENRKYRGDQSLGTTEFLNEQLAEAEERMLDAEQRLGDIQDHIGSTVSQTKLGQATGRLYVVDSRLRDIRHDVREVDEKRLVKRAEYEQLEQMQKRLETRNIEQYLPEARKLDASIHLRDKLMNARAALVALRDKWAPGYPELVNAENEAADQERLLSQFETDQARGFKQRDLEANAAKMALARLELRALETQSTAHQQEEADLKSEAQRLREQLNVPAGQETELLSARREYEDAKEHYSALLKKQEESKAASELERRGQGESVELLEPASLPQQSLPPTLPVRFLIAFGVGLLLGTGLCFLQVMLSPPLLHEVHIEKWAGIPVLASLQPPAREKKVWFRRRAAVALPLLAMLLSSSCTDALMGAAGFWARGKSEERKGKLASAMLYYRQAIRQDARYAPAYESAAMLALRMGELVPARDFLARAVEFAPDNMQLHKMLAEVSYQIYFADPGRPMALLREVEAESEVLRRKWPQAADGYRIMAQVLMERHRLEEAAALLEQSIGKVNRNESLRAQLAAVQFRLGDADAAEQVLRHLMADKPSYRDAYDILYLQLMQKQRSLDARAVLEEKFKATQLIESALQLAAHDDAQGQRAEVRRLLDGLAAKALQESLGMAQIGDFWLHRGEWESAKAAYQKGLNQEQGRRAEYVGRLTEWHLVQGKNKEARELVEAEYKRYPDSPLLEAYLSAVRLGELPSERRAEERRRLESILAKMPDSPFVRYHLGRAYLFENKVSAAAEQFERSIKLDANYTAGWLALAELELSRGNASVAESRASSALQSNQSNIPALLVRARSQAQRGKFAEAEKSFAAVLSLDPQNVDAQYWYASAVASQGRLKEAEKLFADGRKTEPQNPRWLLAQSAALSAAGRLQESRKVLEEAESTGNSADSVEALHQRLAEVQLSMRDGEAARKTFQRLVDLQPKNLSYQLGLAASLALSGKADRALEIYTVLQRSNPENVRVWLEPATLLDELGREDAAIAAYREALKRDKDHPIALNNLAWKLLKQGRDLQLALEYAQHAKRILQRAPEVDGTLAEAYTRLAMYRSASAIYEEMLSYVDEQTRPRIQKLLEAARRLSTEKGKSA